MSPVLNLFVKDSRDSEIGASHLILQRYKPMSPVPEKIRIDSVYGFRNLLDILISDRFLYGLCGGDWLYWRKEINIADQFIFDVDDCFRVRSSSTLI